MPPLPIACRCEHSPKKSLPLCLFSKTFFFVLNVQDEEEEAADEDSVEGLRIAEEVDDGTARVLCARCFSLTHYGCARCEPARGTQQGATDCVGVYLLVQRVMMVLVPLVHFPPVCHLHVLKATAPTCKQACGSGCYFMFLYCLGDRCCALWKVLGPACRAASQGAFSRRAQADKERDGGGGAAGV